MLARLLDDLRTEHIRIWAEDGRGQVRGAGGRVAERSGPPGPIIPAHLLHLVRCGHPRRNTWVTRPDSGFSSPNVSRKPAGVTGNADGINPVSSVHFDDDLCQVVAYRSDREPKLGRDLVRLCTIGGQPQNLRFPW